MADQILKIWNEGDLAMADDLYDPGYIRHHPIPSATASLDEFKNTVISNRTVFPDYKLTFDEIILKGDRIVVFATVTGTNTGASALIAAGGTLVVTYSVTFAYEGVYAFAPAVLEYDHEGNTYSKNTHVDGYTVSPDPLGLLQSMFMDGMPFTAALGGAVALGAIVNIALMARGRGGGGTYQV